MTNAQIILWLILVAVSSSAMTAAIINFKSFKRED